VRDTLPAHVGDVQKAVDAAQVHERAVVGDVLDDAVADFAFLQLADQFGALFGAGLFQDGATRDDDVAARAVHFQDGEGLFLAHQRADVADRTDVHLRARQEGRGAAQVDGEAALHAADDHAVDRHAFGEHDFQTGPGFLAAGLVAADDRFAQRVLDALQIDLDVIADLGDHRAFADAELAGRDTTFGLQTDVDDYDVLLDADHAAVDDLAFAEIAAAEALVEKRGEIVARGGKGSGHETLGLEERLKAHDREGPARGGWSLEGSSDRGEATAVPARPRLTRVARWICPNGSALPRRYGGPHRRRPLYPSRWYRARPRRGPGPWGRPRARRRVRRAAGCRPAWPHR